MLDIRKTTENNTARLIEKAISVSRSFGFSNFEKELDKLPSKRLKAAEKVVCVSAKEKKFLPIMRKLASKEVHKYSDHVLGYHVQSKGDIDNFSLHITGTENPIAEATIIAAAFTLLEDVGIHNPTVHINSLGTLESFTRYMRDLKKALDKMSANLSLQVQADMRVSPVKAYARLCKLNSKLSEKCPNPIDYLNDEGRTHLWELLEYLEISGIPYVLDKTVIGSNDFFEHTLFEIRGHHHNEENQLTFAHGGRYSALGRKAFKKHIPTVGLTIDIKPQGSRKIKQTRKKSPKFYFAQLGTEAKKMGLKILNMLHKAGIMTGHSFTQETLSKQMNNPAVKKVPYIIIMGHKEVLDNTVIVRNTQTYKQKTVPINRLVRYLKNLEK